MPVTEEVGGCCCFGKTRSGSVITFDKSQYYLGEHAKVKFTCDNSACSKEVQRFKFSLQRKFTVSDGKYNNNNVTDLRVIAENSNVGGCPAGQKKEVEIIMPIPTQDPFPP